MLPGADSRAGRRVLFDVPVSSVLLVGLILFCPLGHLLLMRHGEHDHVDVSAMSEGVDGLYPAPDGARAKEELT